MGQARKILLSVFALMCIFGLKSTSFAASDITYKRIDGTPVVNAEGNNVTDSTASEFYSNLDVELAPGGTLEGKTVIAYLYDSVRSAKNPTVFASGNFTDNYAVTVVLAEDVDGAAGKTAHGSVGTSNAIWFVYENKLYITGTPDTAGGVINVADNTYTAGTGYVDQTEEKSFTGTTYETYYPEFHYSDLDGSGSGIKGPETYDEMKFDTAQWYEFSETQYETYEAQITEREPIGLDYRLEGHMYGTLAPSSLGWVSGFASSITDVYISDDIELEGNVSGLFNANFTYIKENGSENDMKDSRYTSLKNVYLYCDLQKVTAAAGMFGRIATLENVYVRPASYSTARPTADPAKLTNMVSVGYMFYGDTNLRNDGEDSFLNAMDLSSSNSLLTTSYMFGGCESITEPSVRDFHMDSVKYAEGMFFGAKNAGLVSDGSGAGHDISGWSLSNVVNAVAMFSGGDADGEINLDDPLLSMDPGLSDISGYGNVITGTVDMRGWDMNSVKMMTMMFSRNGEAFRGVIFDDSYPALIDASGMFLRCDYISSVTMGSSMPELLNSTAMFRMAGSKASVATADLSGWNAPKLSNAAFMFYASGFSTIDTTGISSMSKLVDAFGMFGECGRLQSLGEGALGSVIFTELVNAGSMFINDEGVAKIDTSSWSMPKVSDLSFAFQNTHSLTSGFDTSAWSLLSCTDMECFAESSAVSNVDLSAADTRLVANFAFAFSGNPNLTGVTLSSSTKLFDSAVTLCGTFSDDPALKEVSLSPSLVSGAVLEDARGMFANDTTLAQVPVNGIIRGNVKYMSYFMKNCAAIAAVDTSGWDTAGVIYMQGAWDGCKKLGTFEVGNGVNGAKLKSAGTVFRNCNLIPSSAVNRFISALGGGSGLNDLYEAFKNCYALTSLDLSPLNMAYTVELRRVAAMEEDAGFTTNKLATITVPYSILTADGVILKDNDGSSINMFWVDGDGKSDGATEENTDTDDLLTTFFVNGSPGANLCAYAFGGTNGDNDNRRFVEYKGRTINGEDTGTYEMSGSSDTATMEIVCESTFYTDGTSTSSATQMPLTYSWTKDGKAVEGATEKSYQSDKSGTYVATVVPALLTGSDEEKSATFVLGSSIVGIEAEYKGDEIAVGSNYSLDDVLVELVDSDGNRIELTPSDYTVDSQKVTKQGNNVYTVTYKSGDKKHTATITVPGVRRIGSIKATYGGPSVLVGNEYSKSDVQVIAYYADDTAEKEGFEVTPTSFSATKVTKTGDNEFTVTYKDEESGETFTDTFTVSGYKTISSISATYTGDKIIIGKKYDKKDVKVTLNYADGSGSDTTTNFTVDSQTVTAEGKNSFTASYTDPYGNVYTADFTVPGYEDPSKIRYIGSIKATYTGPSVVVGKEYDPDYVKVVAYYKDDTKKNEGFEVSPTSLSSLVVSEVGDNKFTASYTDPKQKKTFTDTFEVNGYKAISYIKAKYTGDKVKVGNKYDRDKVEVTLYYADGSGSRTTSNFSVDSETVTVEGGNSFTASYRDPFGKVYTAGFSVPGYKDAEEKKEPENNNNNKGPVSSTVVAPSSQEYSASTVKTGTSTGVVQTGTTGKAVLYLVAIVALSALIAFMVIKRRKTK